eukprot:1184947-Amphidinium_carterae.1
MARYQTRPRPEPALQRDDVIPTPLDNIQPEESAATQPAAATSSSATASSSDQPMEVGQPVVQSGILSSTTFTPSRPTSMAIPSDSPIVRPPPGLEDQAQTQNQHIIQWPRVSAEEIKRMKVKKSREDQIQHLRTCKSNRVQHLKNDSMQWSQSHKMWLMMRWSVLSFNEDSKEKDIQKITSEVILQDLYVDANGVDSEKLKKAMIKEMDNLRELTVFTDSDVKSLKSDERSRIIDSRW